MKRLLRKLRDRKGVTLTELLVAIVVLGLVAMTVSVGISAAIHSYRKSVALSEAQTLSSTLSHAIMDELRCATNVETGNGPVTFDNIRGSKLWFSTDTDGQITIGTGTKGSLLIPAAAYSNGNFSANVVLGYSGGLFSVELTIYANEELIRTVNFSVRPLPNN